MSRRFIDDRKLTDEEIIKHLNQCYGTHNIVIVAHVVSGEEEFTITLQDIIEVLNRQQEKIARGDIHGRG